MKFSQIEAIALARHGPEKIAVLQGKSTAANASMVRNLQDTPPPLTTVELAAIADDRWLSTATKCVFCAGFNWKIVEAKWQGFEEAFEGFDLARWIFSNDDDLSRLVSDKRIIRHGAKIRSVAENARYFGELAHRHTSVGKFFANWPVSDQIGLLENMKKRGARLGGMTGQYFLRYMGKDCFILSRDVIAALIRAEIIEKPPISKKAMMQVQATFNQWQQETNMGMTAISRTLAHSI